MLALFALLMQSFVPVLAYAAPTTQVAQSGSCPRPNHGIEIRYFYGIDRNVKNAPPMNYELLPANAVRARPGHPLNVTYEVTVDAAGKLVRSHVIDAPNVPGMKAHIEHVLATTTYAPAVRDCVPFTATVRTISHIQPPEAHTITVIAPVYEPGWSARSGSTCKVPTVTHARYRPGFVAPTPYSSMLPGFPDSEKSIGVDSSYTTTIRVDVNGTSATRAIVTRPSGRASFDAAALAAARRSRYPLTATTCKVLPTDYLWKTTFAYQARP